MKTLSVKAGIALLCSVMLFQTACNEKQTTAGIALGISGVSTAATIQINAIENSRVKGVVTDEEAAKFTEFAERIRTACGASVTILQKKDPLPVKIMEISLAFSLANGSYVLDSNASKELKLAYEIINEALKAASVQLNLALDQSK